MAVDSVVMVLDSAKGIEPQTLKLFAVCRTRGLPILTFVNKLDHPGREALALLDEIERVLGIGAVPINWPIGQGPTFQGVYDLVTRQVLRFERTEHNRRQAPVVSMDLADPRLDGALGAEPVRQLRDEIELLSGAGARFDHDAFLSGKVTPVFFGSALTGFGVEPFLAVLLGLAPSPVARPSDRGLVEPTSDMFSGFIFKIQANMDPRHRDRMAFLRVCSGRFHRDMLVHHARLGRRIRITRPHRLFAREREMLAEAFPGDVVGLVNPGLFAIGDTLSTGAPLRFDSVPRFAPERFAILRCQTLSRQKQFHRG
jgi:peptide chain release factor 3